MAVKEEHQRKTQPNFEARQRQEERKESHERWKKELEVGLVVLVLCVFLYMCMMQGCCDCLHYIHTHNLSLICTFSNPPRRGA
jgi:hypothetical protein